MTGRSDDPGHIVPRSKYLLAAAIAACILGALQLTHLFTLPFGNVISDGGSIVSTDTLLDLMRNYGYIGLFVLMTLESASLPIPSEIVLPFAGYLYYLGVLGFWEAVAVATVAAVFGALIDYYLARLLGRPFVARMLRAFHVGQRGVERAEGWFERSGRWTVFAARFVPVLRSVISLPAGLFRMDVKEFVILTAIGCLVWNVALVYAGYLTAAFGSSSQIDWVALGALVFGVLYIGYFGITRSWTPETASRVSSES